MSHRASGPIGWPAPSFIASSMSSAEAWPASNIAIAWHRKGTSRALTTKPARSLQCTTRLPSTSVAKPAAACATAASVRCVEITSTSRMTVAGLKKCIPHTCSGRLVPMAMSMIGIDDVFVAMIAPCGKISSSRLQMPSLSSSFSGAASIASWHPPMSARSVVQVIFAAAWSRAASSSLPRATALSSDPSTLDLPASTAVASTS